MVITLVANAHVVVYNIWLRRLEMDGQAGRAEGIDNYLDWLYPITFLVAAGIFYQAFF